jgi:hypothetical protein
MSANKEIAHRLIPTHRKKGWFLWLESIIIEKTFFVERMSKIVIKALSI